jgi:uncharacterized protein (TIGR03085 family)
MERVTAPEPGYPPTSGHTSVARLERARLCDLFETVGPTATTRCAAWDAHHLVAHLVVRESTLGILKMMAPGSSDDLVDRLVADRDFTSLVEELRAGPPRLSVFGIGLSDRLFNALEFFVHHEDVRRAEPGYPRRDLPGWALDEVWKGLGLTLAGLMRKAPVGVTLRRSDTGEAKLAAKKPHPVVVSGLPSELALFAYGRGAVAAVTFDGADEDVSRLASARLGF